MHAVMGVQIGIPILLCLLFEVNVLILIICLLVWLLHEAVASTTPHPGGISLFGKCMPTVTWPLYRFT